jgi:hypothetical protein
MRLNGTALRAPAKEAPHLNYNVLYTLYTSAQRLVERFILSGIIVAFLAYQAGHISNACAVV